MHSHLIPGVDDGAYDINQSISLIEGMMELGYSRLFTTPHIMSDLYPNKSMDIKSKDILVNEALISKGINCTFTAAAEYLIDDGFEDKLDSKDILTLPGNRVLVEFSFVSPPFQLERIIFKMLTKGYRPVLAHPERYSYFQRDLSIISRIKEKGVELQINLLSLAGHYGKREQDLAFKIINEDMASFLGSDLHNEEHLKKLKYLQTQRKVKALLTGRAWKNATLSN